MQAEVVISIEDLEFSYTSQPPILQSLSMHIHAGERVGIIGHNGCGKTTLFHLLSGLIQPQAGQIKILDKPVKLGEFRSEIGLVFQDPNDQLFSHSVWEDVAFGPQNLGITSDRVHSQVEAALKLTGTQTLARRPPHHLSGGEKRMVAIAGILAMQPQIILYDEPTANLDLQARRRLIQFLLKTSETLLISSHDLEFILEVCDRVILLSAGSVVADGMPHDIFRDLELLKQYQLEQPYSLQ